MQLQINLTLPAAMQNKKNNYPGNKAIYGTYHKIINEIPVCKNYVELFAGSASIFKLLNDAAPGSNIFLNDIDSSITDKYNFKVPIKI